MRQFTRKMMGTALIAMLGVCSMNAQTHTWKSVNTGDGTTYAIESDGSLWSFGWNESGQMGIDSKTVKTSVPTQVGTDKDWTLSNGGQAYAFFIKSDGTLWAVGNNDSGVSGVNDGATSHKVPVQVGKDTNWKYVTCSRFFGHVAAAIKTDGTLWAWGDGRMGQIGVGSTKSYTVPVQVGTDTDWTQVSVGNNFTLALKNDGSLWGWGFNQDKPLMNNVNFVKSPVQLGTDKDWASIFAVVNTAYGIKKDGTLWVWGENSLNMAGIKDADIERISSPMKISFGEGEKVVAITGCDANRYVGVGEDGIITKVYSWGSNADGALGDGTGVSQDAVDDIKVITEPVVVKLPEGVKFTQLAGGVGYCTVLSTDGKIYGWGKNRAGQLGNYCTEAQMTYVALPIECAVEQDNDGKTYTINANEIPAQLNDAKKLILTGTWSTSSFVALTAAIGNNTGFPPVGNSTIEEIDMSQAQIAHGTYAYVSTGVSNNGVFRGLSALVSVKMPAAEEAANFKSLRSIFQNCVNLKHADISDCVNVTNITDAFYGTQITEVDLSKFNNITGSESAFDHCTKLISAKLPGKMALGKFVFGSCFSLTTIDWSTFAGTTVPKMPSDFLQYVDDDEDFGKDLKNITLIVPDAMVEAFKANADWNKLTIVGATTTGINNIVTDAAVENAIYTIGGVKVASKAGSLPKGLYIINGKKVLVK